MSPPTKHIALPYHFFRTKVVELEIEVIPVSTHSQLADQQRVFQPANFNLLKRLS